MFHNRSFGFWLLISVAVLLVIIFLLGQTMAVINYDFAVSIGLQEPVGEITEIGVALNKGFGLGDTVFYIPLFIIGIVGLLKRSILGLYSMVGAMAITVYWPIVALSTVYYAKEAPGWFFSDYSQYTIFLVLITTYGFWGLSYLYKNQKMLTH